MSFFWSLQLNHFVVDGGGPVQALQEHGSIMIFLWICLDVASSMRIAVPCSYINYSRLCLYRTCAVLQCQYTANMPSFRGFQQLNFPQFRSLMVVGSSEVWIWGMRMTWDGSQTDRPNHLQLSITTLDLNLVLHLTSFGMILLAKIRWL